jgi:predicted anti-sigma-YlaC factor YlaD
VMSMNCREWISEIVECARGGSQPDAQLESHLKACPKCAARWEDEQRLSAQLRLARDAAAGRRSSEARREEIMRRFALVPRRSSHPSWKWVLGAAAVLLLATVLGYVLRNGGHAKPTVLGIQQVAVGSYGFEESTGDANEFVAVAYAPPLAAGEFVSVLRTELQPTALARMGIYVDAAYTNTIPADVLVGEDGFPRAVRVVE